MRHHPGGKPMSRRCDHRLLDDQDDLILARIVVERLKDLDDAEDVTIEALARNARERIQPGPSDRTPRADALENCAEFDYSRPKL